MRPDNGEVLEALGWRRVWNVDQASQVVANRTDFALERAGQRTLGQLELEWEAVYATR